MTSTACCLDEDERARSACLFKRTSHKASPKRNDTQQAIARPQLQKKPDDGDNGDQPGSLYRLWTQARASHPQNTWTSSLVSCSQPQGSHLDSDSALLRLNTLRSLLNRGGFLQDGITVRSMNIDLCGLTSVWSTQPNRTIRSGYLGNDCHIAMRQRRKDAVRSGHADGSSATGKRPRAADTAGDPVRGRETGTATASPQLKETLGVVVLTSIVLSVYTRTLYPSIAGGDSGELVAEACHLGVAHPPGYPLYTMLVHAFTRLLPLGGSIAWRANLFSAGRRRSLSVGRCTPILILTWVATDPRGSSL